MKTTKNKFDNLTAEQIGQLFPIRIVPYNSEWKVLFEQEKVLLTAVFGESLVFNIEHFGSTSVEGLDAKSTIDILVEVLSLSKEIKQFIAEKLETIGYGNMCNAEKEKEMSFGKGYDENYVFETTYHIHIREKGKAPQDEIYFRDYLRQNLDVRDEYAKLKYELAEKYQFNREDYTQAKTEFVLKITEQQKRNEYEQQNASS
jgi:GrpB-like predicted nucleotidyltransferase (UPF0157 family)